MKIKVNIVLQPACSVKSLLLEVDEGTFISDLIKLAIDKFNLFFDKENLYMRLKPLYKLYNLKPSKKNGMAKSDYPCKCVLTI
jgi:hypothetical protein